MPHVQVTNAPKPSPLAGYYRQPKLYLQLPSNGQYYPEGALDRAEDGRYAVYSMTAKDELMYKTPDALMSGQSTVEVIQSCIPSIKDAWKMPTIDVDACLIAIRVATYGDTMDVDTLCPSCNEENTYALQLVPVLDKLSSFQYKEVIQVGDLVVNVKPYTYKEITKRQLSSIEQEKIFNIVNSKELSDEEKIDQFGASFVKLTALTVDVIADSIVSIETPDGVEDRPAEIKNFINNAPKEIFNTINDHLTQLKDELDLNIENCECSHCNYKFTVAINMDQANFFDVRS